MSQAAIFARIAKVDEARHEVTGILAEEAPDKSGEIFDYLSSKPFFQEWNEKFAKTTDGASVGNLREMHEPKAAGKFVAMDYDDALKRITVTAKVVDPAAWRKCCEGVYTGFSIGGKYLKRWADGDYERYTALPSEGSLVDNPCMYGATFEAVKVDGTSEVRKFTKAAKTKTVAGEELPASAFAYVGDPEKTETWKLPIKFSDEEKTKSHIRNALARFDQTEGIPEGDKAQVKAKIEAAAKKHGIDAAEKLAKNLYDVADMATLLAHLDCIRQWATAEAAAEGDGSPVPGKLKDLVEQVGAVLQEMAAEEANELTDGDNAEPVVLALAAPAEDLRKQIQAATEALAAQLETATDVLGKIAAAHAAQPHTQKETETMANDPQLHKIAEHDATLAKMQSEFADFRKDVTDAMTNLSEAIKKLASEPVEPKAAKMAVVVEKSKDGAAADPAEDKSPLAQVKKVHAAGGRRL